MDRIKNIIKNTYNRLFTINSEQSIFKKNNTDSNVCNDNKQQQINNSQQEIFYKYSIQPYEFYIINNIDNLLKSSLDFFKKYSYTLKIGIEIEFYLINTTINIDLFYKDIYDFCKINNIFILDIERERGNNQFEIKFSPYTDIYKLINDYNKLKNYLINKFSANFNDMPFYFDSGSALQVNLSLLDEKEKNLFARTSKNEESLLLYNSIAGLLKTINIFLPFYLSDNKNTIRYNDKINSALYKKGKIPAPTYISWGINNRTCSIRIPIPKNIIDFNKYFEEDAKSRRIEFRVPSSNSDLKFVLYCILNSIAFGLINKLELIDCTYNNVLLNHDNCEKIELKEFSFDNYYEILKTIINI